MYEEGNIIYFTPFYFKNGNTAKDKYFVVLKNVEEKLILATLPTRRDNIPAKDTIKDGCVELPEINLNCFVISEKTQATECGKYFDFPTHIYGHQLDTHTLEQLDSNYKIEDVDYEIWGKMDSSVFEKLIECLRTSNSVKRKHIKLLSQ
jgi:hypothetical protein